MISKILKYCIALSLCVFSAAAAHAQSSINHIVVLLQENRSFDGHFGQLGAYRAANGYGLASDVDGLPPDSSNTNDEGTVIKSFHIRTSCIENISPDWVESHGDYNLSQPGSNTFVGDGYVHNAEGLAKYEGFYDVQGRRAMGYYDGTDLPYYYFMASNFATSDRWFSPLSSNSDPNRIYFFAATSHGHVHDPGSFDSSVVPNIFQRLDAAGITWKIYYQSKDPVTGGPLTQLSRFQPFYSQHTANVVPDSQYFTDLKNGTLPQVAYIEEESGLDEHPGATVAGNINSGNQVQYGAQFAAQHINAFMQSSSWKDGVFFLTYDEAGGLYDHVAAQPAVHPDGIPPQDLQTNDINWIVPQGDFNRTGFRVPLIVISPFARKSYVSHTVADYTALLKFIETRFGLGSLTNRDAAQMNMMEFFNFSNPAWTVPPTPPAQPLTLACNNTDLADHSLSTGTITGRVTKADGTTAIQGAMVTYGGGTSTTDASGNYILTSVPAGSVQITASATGFQSASQTVTVTTGTTTNAPAFALQASTSSTGTITGSVTDGTSAIQGATVSYSGGSATSNASGVYTLSSVPAGSVLLTASATGFQSATQTVTVTSGATTNAPTFKLVAGATCTAPSAPGVVVCSPANGAAVTSPINFVAKATPSSGASISAMYVYLDDVVMFKQVSSATTVITNVNATSGTHVVRTQVWDSSGALFKAGSTVTVGSGSTPAAVTLSPSSLTFASQQTGTTSPAQSVTLTNSGGTVLTLSSIAASGDFGQTNACGTSLNAGASCSISVTFIPTQTGTRTGAITIADSASGSPHTVSLTGTGATTTPAAVTLSPSSLTFASQQVGTTSSSQAVTLTNSGGSTLTLSGIAAGGDFSQTNACGTSLNAGASCSIAVTFTPTQTGSRTGTITVTDSATGSPHTVSLAGTGASTTSTCSPPSAPGAVVCAPANGATVTSPVNFIAKATPASGFAISAMNVYLDDVAVFKQVSNSNTVNINVTVAPGTHVIRTQVWDDSGALYMAGSTITVTSSGAGAVVSLNPGSLTFGSQQVGTTSAGQSVILGNSGGSTLTLSSIIASGDFAQTNNCPSALAAGASCNISVSFAPTQSGTRTGAITISDSASGSPHTVSLTGTGTTTTPVCSAPSAPGVVVCSPSNGATVASPVNFVAKATPASGFAISAMYVYLDDVVVYKQVSSSNTLNVNVTAASGTHVIRTQVWDDSGALYMAGSTITVSP